MHFYAIVILPDGIHPRTYMEAEAAVCDLLAPYEEDARSGWWDWYQVGGRYTGRLDGYDPLADPKNSEPCAWCHATGTRRDFDPNGTPCNGCRATGIAKKWPADWAPHDGDIALVKNVEWSMERCPFTVVVDGTVNQAEYNDKDANTAVARLALIKQYPDRTCVVVDYHR